MGKKIDTKIETVKDTVGCCIIIIGSIPEEDITIANMQAPNMGFPGGIGDKESMGKAGDLGLTPGLVKYPGGGQGNPLQLLA